MFTIYGDPFTSPGGPVFTRINVPARVTRRKFIRNRQFLKIFYQAENDVSFEVFGETKLLSKDESMWGYRPDPFTK